MAGSAYGRCIKGKEREGQSTLEEVTCLPRLQFLAIKLLDVSSLSFLYKFNSLIKRLKKFQFLFSPIRLVSPPGTGKGCLAISDVNVSHASIGWLLVYVTSLDLSYYEGLNGMFKNLVTKSKSSLFSVRSLSIHHCPSLSLSGVCEAQLDVFPNLEELSLDKVSLETIGELNGFLGLRFQKLKLLQVSECRQLKCLFSDQTLAGSLPNLEEIKVVSCTSLEELFSAPVGVSLEPLLPKLIVIRLEYLPQLSTVCSDGAVLEHLEKLEVEACKLLQKDVQEDLAWDINDYPIGWL